MSWKNEPYGHLGENGWYETNWNRVWQCHGCGILYDKAITRCTHPKCLGLSTWTKEREEIERRCQSGRRHVPRTVERRSPPEKVMASKEYWEQFDREVAEAAKQPGDDTVSDFNALRYAKRWSMRERMNRVVRKALRKVRHREDA